MRGYILTVLACVYYLPNAQVAPLWGELECDTSITGKFPKAGDNHAYTGYYRWYDLSVAYPTFLRRDVWISTCIEDRRTDTDPHHRTVWAQLEGYLRTPSNPYYGATDYRNTYYNCDSGEIGYTYKWYDVPEGEYVFGVSSSSSGGGSYKISVQCTDQYEIPEEEELAIQTNKTAFPRYNEWNATGFKRISCGVSAYGRLNTSAVIDYDYYEYEVTDYAQEILFTTCVPDDTAYGEDTRYDGTTLGAHYVRLYYWNYGVGWNRDWDTDSSYASTSQCATLEVGDARSLSSTNILQLSPGKYYVGVDRSGGVGGAYVLSMACWKNPAVKTATEGVDYTGATFNPTQSPVTLSPTTDEPTPAPVATTTLAPSNAPTESFGGRYDNTRKAIEMDTISCGVYRHDTLPKRRTHWYKFEVLSTLDWYVFDTCKDDITKFNARVQLWYLNTNEDWAKYSTGSSGYSSSYCNLVRGSNLAPRIYAIEIYGNDDREDTGDYILRMGCSPMAIESGWTVPVTETAAPTPAPTGIAAIPAKDGTVAGDISCGKTITGSTKSKNGDFHKFTVVGGTIDWVKFDTCDKTEFENYLFCYDHYNLTGHGGFALRDNYNSIGFHYEDGTTCNELEMQQLTPGTYYINIDGYNWYFDHGAYTIKMTCSDNSLVAGARNYTEFVPPLEVWAIVLIIVGSILFIAIIIGVICYCKKKGDAGDSGGDVGGDSGPQPGSAEMQGPGETNQ